MKKILIANRGEIAVRIIKTCREMGIATVAVASEADTHAYHAQFADECVSVGPAPASESYLRSDKILEAALQSKADAIHPGYGFLSENADFAAAVQEAGIRFIGPTAHVIGQMGSKRQAKQLMADAGVPVVPGYNGEDQSVTNLKKQAERIGFPVLIKASAGGGGKGMRVVEDIASFQRHLETAKREAKNAFGDDTVLLERYLQKPRHVEFQIFGDHHGNVIHLFERECSIQRRHQKILEETPSPGLSEQVRKKMAEAAVTAAKSVGYTNAGTVEFMLDQDQQFYFLEMNTRLQVEHPVTEFLTGLDLVRLQIQVALGEKLPWSQSEITARGHAIEVRVYAEDPPQFLPQTGTIHCYREPEGLGIRVDSGVRTGDEVTIYYDPMLAKLIALGATRQEAVEKLRKALGEYAIHGVKTNLAFLGAILNQKAFLRGETTTDYLQHHFPVFSPADDLLQTALALTPLAGERPTSVSRDARKDPWEQINSWRVS